MPSASGDSRPTSDSRYSLWWLIGRYRFNSVFVRNFVIIVLIFLVPIAAIGVFFYAYATDVVETEMRSRNLQDARRYRDITDAYMLQMQHLVLNLATDTDVNAFLFENEANVANSLELYSIVQDMAQMRGLVTAIGYIDSIVIYSVNNGYVLSLDGARAASDTADGSWLREFERRRERRGMWFVLRTNPEDEAVLSLFWNVYLYDRLDGVIVINIDPAAFGSFLQAREEGGVHLSIFDNEGTLLYTGGPAVNADWEPPGANAAVAEIDSAHFDYTVRTITPLSEFYGRFRDMRAVLVWIGVLGIVAALALSFVVSVKVFEPVRNILRFIDGIDEYEDVSSSRGAEVGYIADSISRIVTSEKEAEAELETRVALLRRAQAVALQSQINPHFLYNTLDSVKWTAMQLTRGKNAASEMIGSVSKLLRYSLESGDSITTVGEELEHAHLYLEILTWRYREAFSVKTDVDPEVRSARTVRLSLQPILENAVYHGIKPKKERCRIEIVGRLQREKGPGEQQRRRVVLSIRDDGVGMSPQEVDRINASFAEDFLAERKHIGLRNVNQRIRLVFGEPYGIRLDHSTPTGVVVTLTLPAPT